MENRQSDLDSTVTTLSQQITDQQLHTTTTDSTTTAVVTGADTDADTDAAIHRLEAKLNACIVSHDDKIIKLQVYIILVNLTTTLLD